MMVDLHLMIIKKSIKRISIRINRILKIIVLITIINLKIKVLNPGFRTLSLILEVIEESTEDLVASKEDLGNIEGLIGLSIRGLIEVIEVIIEAETGDSTEALITEEEIEAATEAASIRIDSIARIRGKRINSRIIKNLHQDRRGLIREEKRRRIGHLQLTFRTRNLNQDPIQGEKKRKIEKILRCRRKVKETEKERSIKNDKSFLI